MKLFVDTADVDAIRRAHDTGLLDGVTTNPSKLAEVGRELREVVAEICAITPGPVSAEAMAEDCAGMVAEAVELSSIAPNVVVKIPMTTEGLKAIPIIEKEKNIRVNLTMVFSPTQALMGMKAGPTYLSIVLSRLDAIASDSDALVRDTVTIKRNYAFATEIIAGSVKTQSHMLSCLRAGVDVATIPEALFFKMMVHPLTDAALAQFARDWQTVPQ